MSDVFKIVPRLKSKSDSIAVIGLGYGLILMPNVLP